MVRGVLATAAALLTASAARAAAPAPPIVFSADRLPSVSGEVYRLTLSGRLTNVSRSPFDDTRPLVSPNGRLLAFVSTRSGSQRVYVSRLGGSSVRDVSGPLRPSGGNVEIAWSPAGDRLAVTSSNGRSGHVSVFGLEGGRRLLGRDVGASSPGWSPDGRLVTASVQEGAEAWSAAGGKRWIVDATQPAGGWSKRGLFAAGQLGGVVQVLDESGHTVFSVKAESAAWSPDGSRLVATRKNRLEVRTAANRLVLARSLRMSGAERLRFAGARRVVVDAAGGPAAVDLRTGRISRLAWSAYASGAWSRDGVAATTARAGNRFALEVGGRVVGHVPGCWDDAGYIAAITALQFTPDGRSLVYQSQCLEPFANLYAVSQNGASLRRLTTAAAQQRSPALSPDGTRLVYTTAAAVGLSCKGCPQALAITEAGGRNPRALTTPSGPDYGWDDRPSWSPDGETVLYDHSTVSTPSELMTVDRNGGKPVDLHVAGSFGAYGPARIAFVDTGTDPATLWSAAPDGRDRQKIAAGPIAFPAWSRDGRLAWLQQPRNGGAPFRVVTSAGTTVTLPFVSVRSLAWSADGTRFVLAAKAKGTPSFDVYTVATDGSGLKRLTRNLDVLDASS